MRKLLLFAFSVSLFTTVASAESNNCVKKMTTQKTSRLTNETEQRGLIETLSRNLSRHHIFNFNTASPAEMVPYENFFNQGLYKQEPAVAAASILKLMIFGRITEAKRYLQLSRETLANLNLNSIRLSDDEKVAGTILLNYVAHLAASLGPDLVLLARPFIHYQSDEVKALRVNQIAEILAAQAAKDPLIGDLSTYARFKMIKEYVRKTFGITHIEKLRDIAVKVKGNKFTVLGYSNQPINGVKVNKYGFSIAVIETFVSTKSGERHVQWTVGNETLSAKIKFQKVDPRSYIPKAAAAPDYKELVEDGFGGIVVISNNMDGFGYTLAGNYKDYFTQEGFQFTRRRVRSEEAKSFILSQVRSGNIDFFVREGHSEFSQDQFVKLPKNLNIFIGKKKKRGANYDETIFIIGPSNESRAPGVDIAFSELGEALRNRPKNTNDFLFFETACYSADGTKQMIQATGAPGFIPFGSTEMEDTFTGQGNTGIDILLNGIRSHMSYAEIQERLNDVNPDEAGNQPSGFVTPNEHKYGRGSRGNLSPYIISIERDYEVYEE